MALPNTLRGDTVPARAATESAAAGATKTAYMRRKPVTGPPENPGYGGPRTLQPTVTTKGAPKEDPGGWVEGTTIPAEYYVDDMHFAADERFLADALWMMVDHESRIPNAGDYFTFEYGRSESILIVRDKAGKVNGYYNVCQHRGSRLCRHADHPAKEQESRISVRQLGKSGNTPVFRCPYHAWTYDLEGNLIYAYAMGDDFDPGEHGLKPCNLRVSEGHIFVNLSQGEPPDFEEATARFQALAKHYGMKDLKVAVREQYTMLGTGSWVSKTSRSAITVVRRTPPWSQRITGTIRCHPSRPSIATKVSRRGFPRRRVAASAPPAVWAVWGNTTMTRTSMAYSTRALSPGRWTASRWLPCSRLQRVEASQQDCHDRLVDCLLAGLRRSRCRCSLHAA